MWHYVLQIYQKLPDCIEVVLLGYYSKQQVLEYVHRGSVWAMGDGDGTAAQQYDEVMRTS